MLVRSSFGINDFQQHSGELQPLGGSPRGRGFGPVDAPFFTGLCDPEPHRTDRAWQATTQHEYPAALERLWRAHFGMVENPPDVIVSLKDDYYSGAGGFAAFAKVASTHGGLNKSNSTTFIMSTAGPLPPVMQSADIPKAMKTLTGADWPTGK